MWKALSRANANRTIAENARDLAESCTQLVRQGKDFPTVWGMMLKDHGLVEGIPRQRLDGARSLIEISLTLANNLCLIRMKDSSASDREADSGMHAVPVRGRRGSVPSASVAVNTTANVDGLDVARCK
jgi:hypothetical protein